MAMCVCVGLHPSNKRSTSNRKTASIGIINMRFRILHCPPEVVKGLLGIVLDAE